jgi:hypothetical protein
MLMTYFPLLALLLFAPLFDLTYARGKSARVMILAHGMGSNHTISDSVRVDQTLVSFNFPDHDFLERGIPYEQTTFGTFDELIPLLLVMKKYVIEEEQGEIDLYGFSAGGGAIVNALAALNTNRFDGRLQKIGIPAEQKTQILKAVEKGTILLDVPLKSLQELIDLRGKSRDLLIMAARYQANDMEPMEALKYLKGLTLNVIIHFQSPDEVLFNRDDDLYFERFKAVNPQGTTTLIIGKDGGHNAWHRSLWEYYSRLTMRTPVSSENL